MVLAIVDNKRSHLSYVRMNQCSNVNKQGIKCSQLMLLFLIIMARMYSPVPNLKMRYRDVKYAVDLDDFLKKYLINLELKIICAN